MAKWKTNLVNAFPNPYPITQHPTAPPVMTPEQPFPFFKLPSELRNRIYVFVLFTSGQYSNNSAISLLLASRRLHTETSYLLYSSTAFRIFPLQDFNPLPTVRDLPPHYRKLVTTTELVLGPSWTAPPKSWKVNKSMAKIIGGMASVHTIKVFVEIDPSHPVFANFRVSHEFYTDFCSRLLRDVLKAMPKLEVVQIAARPSVQMDGPLISRLRGEVEAQGRKLRWGEIGNRISVEDKPAKVALDRKVSLKDCTSPVQTAEESSPRDKKASSAST